MYRKIISKLVGERTIKPFINKQSPKFTTELLSLNRKTIWVIGRNISGFPCKSLPVESILSSLSLICVIIVYFI